MKILIILFLVSSCIKNEGDITVIAKVPSNDQSNDQLDDTSENSNNNPSSQTEPEEVSSTPNPESTPEENSSSSESSSSESSSSDPSSSSSSSQVLIDFEDSTTYGENFVTSYKSSSYFSASFGVDNTLLGSKTVKCTTVLNSRTRGSCIHTSTQTFNLPITVEFEFYVESSYFTGSKVGLSFYQDDGSQGYDANYNFVNSGTNALAFYWQNRYNSALGIPWYSRYIEGFGQLSSIDPTQNINLGDQGKINLDIDAVGNWTLTYDKYDTSKNITATETYTGTLSTLPSNFKLQIFQGNYSNTSRSDTGNGQYSYLENIIIEN